MTFQFATVPTRRLKPSHELWKPHSYQKRATDFLLHNGAAALFADPGTGKTSTVLNTVSTLLSEGVARKVLVIAPKRVCELVWWQESRRWSQFRHLEFAWLHDSRAPWDQDGSPKKKDAELKRDADIYLINPEGVAWLGQRFYGRQLPFDTVVVDELTKFKNAQAKRSKTLRKLTARTPRLWGLTGTPTPNGYEDLFGQILLLDGGNALGKYFKQFRDKYFVPDGYTGFEYKLAEGADKRIEQRIAHMVLRIDANDYLDLPELVDDVRVIKLDPKSRSAYDKMKRDMLLTLEGGVVTAANSAALYSKLSQMANGAVYTDDDPLAAGPRGVAHIHDAKLDALEELVDELAGQPLLVGYEFNHDIKRLLERFPGAPYIGSGVGGTRAMEIEKAWNAGEIPVLFAHPASTGHGLNLQRGGACHVAWFSASWDFELYDQFIQRVKRQGNDADRVINHVLAVEDTIDVLKLEALREKDSTQKRLLGALKTALDSETLRFADNPAAGHAAVPEKEADMAFKKLSRKDDSSGGETKKFTPKGWGKPAAEETEEEEEEQEDGEDQQAAIQNKLRGGFKPRVVQSEEAEEEDEDDTGPPKSAFSREIAGKLSGEEAGEAEETEEQEEPMPAKASAPKSRKGRATAPQKDTEKAESDEGDVYSIMASESGLPRQEVKERMLKGLYNELTQSQIDAIAAAAGAAAAGAASAAVSAALEKILGR